LFETVAERVEPVELCRSNMQRFGTEEKDAGNAS